MHIRIQSVLPCSADAAWNEVVKTRLLLEVAAPLVTFRAADGMTLPEFWPAGGTVYTKPSLFGVFPMGVRAVHFERIDPIAQEIQTREWDPMIRRWDHLMRFRPLGPDRCRYSDELDIDAGLLTVGVCLFAKWFYRHRQRRWHAVARRLRGRR